MKFTCSENAGVRSCCGPWHLCFLQVPTYGNPASIGYGYMGAQYGYAMPYYPYGYSGYQTYAGSQPDAQEAGPMHFGQVGT